MVSDQFTDTIEYKSGTHTEKDERKNHQNDDDVL